MDSHWMESSLLEAFGWTLVHSIWQLSLIAIVFFVGRGLLHASVSGGHSDSKRTNEIICLLACACLLGMLVVPLVTFPVIATTQSGRTNLDIRSSELWPDHQPATPGVASESSALEISSDPFAVVDAKFQTAFGADSTANDLTTMNSLIQAGSMPRRTLRGAFSGFSSFGYSLSAYFNWIVAGWTIGVLVFSLRPLLGIFNARRLSKRGHVELPKVVCEAAHMVVERMGIARSIEFVGSVLVDVPTVVGCMKPIVLIPASAITGLSPDQLNQILAHEIAHIRRHDYLINLTQTVIETLLFYHPAVWWLSNQIRTERENCCDDMAVSFFGDSQSLAQALTQLEQSRGIAPPALAASGGSLVRRVRRLLGRPASTRKVTAGGVCGSAFLLIVFATSTVFAFRSPPTEPVNPLNVASEISRKESIVPANPSLTDFHPDIAQPAKVAQQVSRETLATVNGQALTRSQIARRCVRIYGDKVLENLIDQELIRQSVEANGIVIEESSIDQHLQVQADKCGMSLERFIEMIHASRKLSEKQLRERTRSELQLHELAGLVDENEHHWPKRTSEYLAAIRQTANLTLKDLSLQKQKPDVVAIVNGTKISYQRLTNECFAKYGKTELSREVNSTILKQALENRGFSVAKPDIDEELSRAAKTMGHIQSDGSADIETWLKMVMGRPFSEGPLTQSQIDRYVENEVWPTVALRKLAAPDVTVTDKELQQAFESNFGPRAKVLAIVCKQHKQALKVWNLASEQPTAENFGRLASQFSEGPASRQNHGQVPPIQTHGGRDDLENAAFDLKPNEISPIVQVGNSWVILFGMGRTDPIGQDVDLADLRADVFEKKLRSAMGEKFKKLTESATILKNEVLIGAASNPPQVAPEVPNKRQSKLATKTYAIADFMVPSPFAPFKFPKRKKGKSRVDPQPLIELIQNDIRPDSWQSAGKSGLGTLSFHKSNLSLIVSHEPEVHDEIQDLFKKLRELDDVTIDLRGFLVLFSDEELKKSHWRKIPTTPAKISQHEAEILHGLAFVNDLITSFEFKQANVFNGQETTLVFPDLDGVKLHDINVTHVHATDRESVNSVVKFNNVERDQLESQVMKNTANGECMTVDVSRILPNHKPGHRAVLVIRPYVLHPKQD